MTLDPITLLIILLFIVLPIINSLTRGQQQRSGQPGRRPGPQPQGRAQGQGQGGGGAGPVGDDTFSRRLEEARRRVQEAMGDAVEGQPEASRPGPESRPDPGASDTIGGGARDDTIGGSDPRQTVAGRDSRQTVAGGEPRRTVAEPARSGADQQFDPSSRLDPSRTPETRYQRLGEQSLDTLTSLKPERPPDRPKTPAKKVVKRVLPVERLHPKDVLRFDVKGVYRGMIWHQILSEPRAKRPHRRKRSRRPSPSS